MDIQRLRNLTTGRLHTKIEHVYQDIEYLTGEKGIMTHMLPNACRALQIYLRQQAPDPRLWEDAYDTSHNGEVEIKPMNKSELEEFRKRYEALPSLLDGKDVGIVVVK